MKNTEQRSKTKNIYIGLGLQAFALIFAYLCLTFIPFIGWLPAFYVAPVIFIVGIVFIFFSRTKLVYKFLFGFWIIAVPIAISGEKYYQRQFIQREVYLIPQTYRGFVRVNFNEPAGVAAEIENDAILLKVNSDGSLNTAYKETELREELQAEIENYREYYSIDEAGKRTKLKVFRGIPAADSTSREVLVVPHGTYFSSDGKTVSQIKFHVGTPSEFQKYFKLEYLDSKSPARN